MSSVLHCEEGKQGIGKSQCSSADQVHMSLAQHKMTKDKLNTIFRYVQAQTVGQQVPRATLKFGHA